MLHELRVENLLLIEKTQLRLGPGLNVLTGETGAGKTVLAHALDLLLGGRSRAGIVRPGAAEAYVEGVFDLPDDLRVALGERVAIDAEEIVLARRVSAEGRTRAYINGRSAGVGELRAAAERLLAFYGQHEHRRLTLASSQLDLLDAFCGPEQSRRREQALQLHAEVAALERSLDELRQQAGARERELDLLIFELGEIEAAEITESERLDLVARRDRLRHVEALRAAAFGGLEALTDEQGGAVATLASALGQLEQVDGVDEDLDPLIGRWRDLALEASELASELRSYGDGLEAQPGELDAVEERIAVIEKLCRKHGGSVESVLEHADACRDRRAELENAEASFEESESRLGEARVVLDGVCADLRTARVDASGLLAEAVRARLDGLAMEGASFRVAVESREPGPTGADAVEFMLAPNPGVPESPLRETASGGELSRVMLALLSVANDGRGATLVFDEVDAGIGGHTARAVGEQLRMLAEGRQIVCITHLPQVASLASRHFSIEKDTAVEPARTTVRALRDSEIVDELTRMLGADATDEHAQQHALDLLAAA
ncbi:MAG TPA: DNA repair protein RecN [Baekduia sp.]|nr:DNA repair protein RecN [Baekduia sp.]